MEGYLAMSVFTIYCLAHLSYVVGKWKTNLRLFCYNILGYPLHFCQYYHVMFLLVCFCMPVTYLMYWLMILFWCAFEPGGGGGGFKRYISLLLLRFCQVNQMQKMLRPNNCCR